MKKTLESELKCRALTSALSDTHAHTGTQSTIRIKNSTFIVE